MDASNAGLLTLDMARMVLRDHCLEDVLGDHVIRSGRREEITGVIGARPVLLREIVIVARSSENYITIAITINRRGEERLLSSLLNGLVRASRAYVCPGYTYP